MTIRADRRAPLSFDTIQQEIFRSFTPPATWLPRTFPHYTVLGDDRKPVVSRRSEYLAHPQLELARIVSDTKDDDLTLLSKYSPTMVTTGITVVQEDWMAQSAFLVVCFEPDTFDHKCCYSRWTGLDCQVIWGHKLSYRKLAPFSCYNTSIDECVAERGAEVFIKLLNSLFV